MKLGDTSTDSSSDDTNNSSDIDSVPWLALQPECAIVGKVTRVDFFGDVTEERNIRGADSWRDEGDFSFRLEDPKVALGALHESMGRDESEEGLIRTVDASPTDFYNFDVTRSSVPSDDFLLADVDNDGISEMVRKIDGDYTDVGIEYAGSNSVEFPSEEVNRVGPEDDLVEMPVDAVEIQIGGVAGRLIAHNLDLSQGRSAYRKEDGEVVPGLIEFPPTYGSDDHDNDEDGYPRAATYPNLHSELQGEEIAIVARYGDEYQGHRQHLYDAFLWEDGAETISEMPQLTARSTNDLFEPELDERPSEYIHFEYDDGDTSDGDTEDTDVDFSGLEDEIDGMLDDSSTSYDDLSDTEQEIVDTVVSKAESSGKDEVPVGVVENITDGAGLDATAENLQTVVNAQL